MSGMHDDDQHAAASFKTMSMSSLAPTSARGNQQRRNESTFFSNSASCKFDFALCDQSWISVWWLKNAYPCQTRPLQFHFGFQFGIRLL